MELDAVGCAGFLLSAFTLAGVAQTAWLRSRWSRRLARPLDGGRSWRGRRLLGDHKTWTGFVVMVPATGLAFAGLAACLPAWREAAAGKLWPLTIFEYLGLGGWAGAGFMLGELPNSFLKRRAGIASGESPRHPGWRALAFLTDQTDSVIGALAALACLVRVPWLTCGLLVLLGPLVHWLFNVLLWLLGVKKRAA